MARHREAVFRSHKLVVSTQVQKGRVIKSTKIAVAGAGRMGQALADTIQQQPDLALTGTWRRGDDLASLLEACDVLIDFSLPEGTEIATRAAIECGVPMVCGVSGLDERQTAQLKIASASLPVVFDRNMSLGVAVLERSVRAAAAALGPEFAVEIAEVHHVHKKDSPSGTALKLGDAVTSVRPDLDGGDIRYVSERRGEVPGDHEVTLRSETESVAFVHSVTTRQVFVDGALRAARWVAAQAPGLYSMQDVLFGDEK